MPTQQILDLSYFSEINNDSFFPIPSSIILGVQNLTHKKNITT